MSKAHPTHVLEWRDSSHYEYVCIHCDTADTPNGWGKLALPCSAWCNICNRHVLGLCEDTDHCSYYVQEE